VAAGGADVVFLGDSITGPLRSLLAHAASESTSTPAPEAGEAVGPNPAAVSTSAIEGRSPAAAIPSAVSTNGTATSSPGVRTDDPLVIILTAEWGDGPLDNVLLGWTVSGTNRKARGLVHGGVEGEDAPDSLTQ
jgi:hypothetical protein